MPWSIGCSTPFLTHVRSLSCIAMAFAEGSCFLLRVFCFASLFSAVAVRCCPTATTCAYASAFSSSGTHVQAHASLICSEGGRVCNVSMAALLSALSVSTRALRHPQPHDSFVFPCASNLLNNYCAQSILPVYYCLDRFGSVSLANCNRRRCFVFYHFHLHPQ